MFGDGHLPASFKESQINDFHLLQKLFEEYIFSLDVNFWIDVVKELSTVIKKCDEIDYHDNSTAIAYAVWHFLDRYHRFQIILEDLLLIGFPFSQTADCFDVLDVGSGPAQTLFALSDFFKELGIIDNKEHSINAEYVEQSSGFKNFLHYFVEFAICKGKQYSVPYHFAKSSDAFSIPFEEYYHPWYDNEKLFKTKSRYDVVVFNNFLTNIDFVKSFSQQLKRICKFTRNNGVIIVIGANEQSEKYSKIYITIKETVKKKFRSWNFFGDWTIAFEKDYSYRYDDEIGKRLRDHKKNVVSFLQKTQLQDNSGRTLWDIVSVEDKKRFMDAIEQTPEKTAKEKWPGIRWKCVVYQKHSYPTPKLLLQTRRVHRNQERLTKII